MSNVIKSGSLNLLEPSGLHPGLLRDSFTFFYSPHYIVKMDLILQFHIAVRSSIRPSVKLSTRPQSFQPSFILTATRTRSLPLFIGLLKIHVKEGSNINTVQAVRVECFKL